MTKDKSDVTRTTKPHNPAQAEATPNPHNESDVIEMPVMTDQSAQTDGRNVGQTPSTREGRLHPSVGEGVAGRVADTDGMFDTDSMFNDADPQASSAGAAKSETTRRRKNKKQA